MTSRSRSIHNQWIHLHSAISLKYTNTSLPFKILQLAACRDGLAGRNVCRTSLKTWIWGLEPIIRKDQFPKVTVWCPQMCHSMFMSMIVYIQHKYTHILKIIILKKRLYGWLRERRIIYSSIRVELWDKKVFHAILISRLKKNVESPSVLYELPTLENPWNCSLSWIFEIKGENTFIFYIYTYIYIQRQK